MQQVRPTTSSVRTVLEHDPNLVGYANNMPYRFTETSPEQPMTSGHLAIFHMTPFHIPPYCSNISCHNLHATIHYLCTMQSFQLHLQHNDVMPIYSNITSYLYKVELPTYTHVVCTYSAMCSIVPQISIPHWDPCYHCVCGVLYLMTVSLFFILFLRT